MMRKLLSPIEYATGLCQRRWRAYAGGRGTVVLMYHRVDPPRGEILGPTNLYGVECGVPLDVFEQQMRFMLRHFAPRRAADLGRPADRPSFAVTFDDGYADNLTFAGPVLARLGVPATLFLSTDFIGTDRRFWWETLGAMIRETKRDRLGIEAVGSKYLEGLPSELTLGDDAQRESAHWHVSEKLMRTPAREIDGLLTQLAEALDVEVRLAERDWPLLDWQQVAALESVGIEIGSHGAGHINLGLAAPDEAREDILSSVRRIESEVGQRVETFAYPYGAPEHRSDAAISAVEEAGCQLAFTTDDGVVGDADPALLLPRTGLTRGDPFTCAYRVDGAFRASSGARAR